MMDVAHHGIHWTEEGIAFLQQGEDGQNAIGWRKPSPFKVMKGCAICNTRINLSKYAERVDDHPLVQMMLPVPKRDWGVYWLEDKPDLIPVLMELSRLSSPISPVVMPFWSIHKAKLVRLLMCSNVQPIVLTGVVERETSRLEQVVQLAAASPAKLILTGSSLIPKPTIATRIAGADADPIYFKDRKVNYEKMGARALRDYMQGQP